MNRKTAFVTLVFTLAFVGWWPAVMSAWPSPQGQRNLIWHDPEDVRLLNLAWGEGGQVGRRGSLRGLRLSTRVGGRLLP